MTAQAGAVAALESLRLKFTSGNSVPVERSTITREEYEGVLSALYSSAPMPPPAAVPVEALEGLVAELTEEMSIDANGSDAYAFCVKRLTTLIKERSNGS